LSEGERASIRGQALKFLLVGVLSAGTHYAIYVVLIVAAGMAAVPATVIGFVFGTLVSYVLNSRFTFEAERTPTSFVRFWVVTLAGGGVNAGLVWVLVFAGLHFAISGVVAIAIAAAFNFFCHRAWTFADSSASEAPYQA